ncbi:MAG TPA: dienelactone hydrolase family protein [Xanthobacteraceae bacterium]|nr:dienelactone hydrolase family protein [Xanthobacteraceae bacterium]
MVTTQTIALTQAGGRNFDAYLARPDKGQSPSVMIFTEMFGIGRHNRDMAEDFARRGCNALIPNLFWRSAYPGELAFEGPDRDAAWARLAAFDVDAAGGDIGAAVQWLRAQPFSDGKVFALGFCAGGRMAFVAAARAGVDAAVSFYGMGIAKHDAEFGRVTCPVHLHYGLKDPHIPRPEVEAVMQAAQSRPNIEVFLYPDAGHSFFNPIRPGYHAPSAKIAGERLDTLIDRVFAAAPA